MKKFFATQVIFTAVSYWIILPLGLKGSCTKWKLVRGVGGQEFEGLVEVQFNGMTVNICSNFDKIEDVCKYFRQQTAVGVQTCDEKHTTNVFGAKLSNYSIIESASCNKTNHSGSAVLQRTCQKNERADDCCEAVSVCCCGIGSLEQCSANWSTILEKNKPPRGKLVTATDVRYLNSSFNISWTASALQGVGGNIESVRNCSNHCLNKPTYSKHFGVINGACSCNDKMYSVVDNTPRNVSLCIAAKKADDKPLLSAENCDTFLPWLIVDRAWLISTTQTRTGEATSRYHTSPPLSTVSDNSSVVTWSIIAVILVCLVFVLCLWKCRKRRRAKAERQMPNSVSNRTYGEEMLRQTDDEEYSLITDIARGDVTYRPPQLPDRNGPTTINGEDANIVTIDDYSSPSDVIKEDFQSDVADEYSTTYDDPIRHPSRRKKRVANCGSSFKEENISIVAIQNNEEMSDTKINDADVSTLLKMECNIIARINAGGSQDVDTDIECVTKEEDFKTPAETISQTNNEDIKKAFVTENNEITGAGLCAGRSDSFSEEDSESVDHPAHSYEILVGNSAALAEKVPVEMEMNYEDTNIIDGNFPEKLRASNTKLNDYEGTDVIDGKYPTKPKLVFSEHVCLDCLSPEHLRKFGITIISDDDYCGSHESVKSSLSEPLHHSCYNEEVDDQVSVIQRENSGIKPSKHAHADRECSVCHTIYDELGSVKQKQWDRNTDNVYDKFCKYEHTKRGNLTKKRLKSS